MNESFDQINPASFFMEKEKKKEPKMMRSKPAISW
jgi:hypothetical protein